MPLKLKNNANASHLNFMPGAGEARTLRRLPPAVSLSSIMRSIVFGASGFQSLPAQGAWRLNFSSRPPSRRIAPTTGRWTCIDGLAPRQVICPLGSQSCWFYQGK